MTLSTANSPEKAPKTPSLDAQMLERVHPTSKSFAEIFHSPNDSFIPIKSISTFKGEKAIRFSKEEVNLLSKPFKYTLVGKFTHGNQGLDRISNFLDKVGLQADFSVGFLDKKHVLLRFRHEEDFLRIWMGKQWLIDGRPMRVLRWSYDFKPGSEPTTTTVWIELHLLPIHLYNKSSLFSIASAFGTPLMLDTATANLSRPNLARICIEIDLSKTLTNRVWIGYGIEGNEEGFWQQCVYEQLPEFCNFCRKVGHNEHECKVCEEMPQGKKQNGKIDKRKEKEEKRVEENRSTKFQRQKEGVRNKWNKNKESTKEWVVRNFHSTKENKKDETDKWERKNYSMEDNVVQVSNKFQLLEQEESNEVNNGKNWTEKEIIPHGEDKDMDEEKEEAIPLNESSPKPLSIIEKLPSKICIRDPKSLEIIQFERVARPILDTNSIMPLSNSGYYSESSYETFEEEHNEQAKLALTHPDFIFYEDNFLNPSIGDQANQGNKNIFSYLEDYGYSDPGLDAEEEGLPITIHHHGDLVVDLNLSPRKIPYENEDGWTKAGKKKKWKGAGVQREKSTRVLRSSTRKNCC